MADKNFVIKNGIVCNSIFTAEPTTGLISITANVGIGANVLITPGLISIGNSTVNTSINSSSIIAPLLNTGSVVVNAISILTGNSTVSVYIDNGHIGYNNTAPAIPFDATKILSQIGLPSGNTGNRASGANGHIRYNSDLTAIEGFVGGSWGALALASAIPSVPSATTNALMRAASNNITYATPNTIFGAAAPVSIAYASSLTINLATGINFEIGTLTGAINLVNPASGMDPGRSGLIVFSNVNSQTITFDTAFKFISASFTTSTGANTDAVSYMVWNSSMIICGYNKGIA